MARMRPAVVFPGAASGVRSPDSKGPVSPVPRALRATVRSRPERTSASISSSTSPSHAAATASPRPGNLPSSHTTAPTLKSSSAFSRRIASRSSGRFAATSSASVSFGPGRSTGPAA